MKYKHQFRRFLQKLAIDINKKFYNYNYIKSSYNNECLSICQKLISDPNSELFVSPLSAKKYIKNDEKEIFVILQGNTISITNHVYNYMVLVNPKTWSKIIENFNKEQEYRCEKLESEININIKKSLKNINTTLNNHKYEPFQ